MAEAFPPEPCLRCAAEAEVVTRVAQPAEMVGVRSGGLLRAVGAALLPLLLLLGALHGADAARGERRVPPSPPPLCRVEQ